jgi:hypothetical protein
MIPSLRAMRKKLLSAAIAVVSIGVLKTAHAVIDKDVFFELQPQVRLVVIDKDVFNFFEVQPQVSKGENEHN